MFDLTGKCALVTGASGGIGGAIAQAFHARGAKVALSGTKEDRLRTLADRMGERTFVLPCDLSDGPAVDALPDRAAEAMGALDILVANAGITRDNLFIRMKDEEWNQVLAVNLTSYFRLARAAARRMIRARFGRIIGISSVVAITGNPGQANYAASKAGMIGMTKSLAAEVASRGVTVNCIAPGFIETAMTEGLNERQREAILVKVPMARLGTAAEIAAAAVFLASEEASYVTGHTLDVNGGMAMI